MISLIVLCIIKVLDNMVSTAKSITTYQNRKILTSILVIISQFMFYFIIKSIVSDSSTISTIMVCICSGIGTYVAMVISDKTKKDVLFTNILTCSCEDSIMALCDYCLEHKIKYIPMDSYDRQKNHSITVMVFTQTRSESKLLDSFIAESETKYLRQILR